MRQRHRHPLPLDRIGKLPRLGGPESRNTAKPWIGSSSAHPLMISSDTKTISSSNRRRPGIRPDSTMSLTCCRHKVIQPGTGAAARRGRIRPKASTSTKNSASSSRPRIGSGRRTLCTAAVLPGHDNNHSVRAGSSFIQSDRQAQNRSRQDRHRVVGLEPGTRWQRRQE